MVCIGVFLSFPRVNNHFCCVCCLLTAVDRPYHERKCVEREERRVARKTAALEEGGKTNMTWDEKQAARSQIFSTRAPCQTLLRAFALRSAWIPPRVDAVDYDVYEWDVKFRGGFPAAGIANDLEMLEAVNGYGHIQPCPSKGPASVLSAEGVVHQT